MNTYTVTLRDTRDGFTKTIEQEWGLSEPWGDSYPWVGYWLDGNNSCDCNRSRYLYRYDEDKQTGCGDDIIEILAINPGFVCPAGGPYA